MLTRLRVKGFKSLEDVEIRFGPLTCIVGPNNAGKSNLFDAITFLSRLAEVPIMEAVRSVRSSGVASLFTQTAHQRAQVIGLEADLLIDSRVTDDFGRECHASATYLRYTLELRYSPGGPNCKEEISLKRETLSALPKADLPRTLGFSVSKEFLASVYHGSRKRDFISMDDGAAEAVLHRDSSSGQPVRFPLTPRRTVLSSVNTVDFPTVLAVKREMQSWVTLGLELSALRRPDEFYAPAHVSSQGRHLPATLERLESREAISTKLAELVPDVDEVFVRADTERETKTLSLKLRSGVVHDAKTLSDGLLRFLALAILEADVESGRLLCVEEPENGLHPKGMASVLALLKQIPVDPTYALGPDNPLRQVIVNTHAPALVQSLRLDELLICHTYRGDGALLSAYSPLQNTWRDNANEHALGLGAVFAYLNGDLESPYDLPGALNIKQMYEQELALFQPK